MRVTLLGTGTSHGVPAIGCDCPVCHSTDPRDRRMRPSILIDLGDPGPPAGGRASSAIASAVRFVLVDTSTDLRALREGTHTMPKGLPWAFASVMLFGIATYTIGWASQQADPVSVLWFARTSAAVVFGLSALFFRLRRGFALTQRPWLAVYRLPEN